MWRSYLLTMGHDKGSLWWRFMGSCRWL